MILSIPDFALFSLDAYLRGEVKLDDLGQSFNGSEIVHNLAEARIAQDAEAAGFYALAYEKDGEIVISYRGTDQLKDVFSGWIGGAGVFSADQLQLAMRFYQSVKTAYPDHTISLTGHSLGGGLAGFVSSLTGERAVIFDNMTYEWSAELAHFFAKAATAVENLADTDLNTLQSYLNDSWALSLIGKTADTLEFSIGLSGKLFDPGSISVPINWITDAQELFDGTPVPPSDHNVTKIAIDGEVLQYVRGFLFADDEIKYDAYFGGSERTDFVELASSFGNVLAGAVAGAVAGPFGAAVGAVKSALKVAADEQVEEAIQKHSMALLVANIVLQSDAYSDERDHVAFMGGALFDRLYRDDIANHLGIVGSREGDAANILFEQIAYSAATGSGTPYGTTALSAMFSDAADVGRVLDGAIFNFDAFVRAPEYSIRGHLADSIVLFAGGLAHNQVSDLQFSDGFIRTQGEQIITLDYSYGSWSQSLNVFSSDDLWGREVVIDLFDYEGYVETSPIYDALPTEAAMRELWGSTSTSTYERLHYVASDVGVEADLAAIDRSYAKNGAPETYSRDGHNDIIRLTDHPDSVYGSNRNELIDAGAGADVVLGGGGDDLIVGGAGADWIDGGVGRDFVVYHNEMSAYEIVPLTNDPNGYGWQISAIDPIYLFGPTEAADYLKNIEAAVFSDRIYRLNGSQPPDTSTTHGDGENHSNDTKLAEIHPPDVTDNMGGAFTVLDELDPGLELLSVAIDDSIVRHDQTLVIESLLHNAGPDDSGTIRIRHTFSDSAEVSGSRIIGVDEISSLAPGETRTVRSEWVLPYQPAGDRHIVVEAVPVSLSIDDDRSDNIASITVTVVDAVDAGTRPVVFETLEPHVLHDGIESGRGDSAPDLRAWLSVDSKVIDHNPSVRQQILASHKTDGQRMDPAMAVIMLQEGALPQNTDHILNYTQLSALGAHGQGAGYASIALPDGLPEYSVQTLYIYIPHGDYFERSVLQSLEVVVSDSTSDDNNNPDLFIDYTAFTVSETSSGGWKISVDARVANADPDDALSYVPGGAEIVLYLTLQDGSETAIARRPLSEVLGGEIQDVEFYGLLQPDFAETEATAHIAIELSDGFQNDSRERLIGDAQVLTFAGPADPGVSDTEITADQPITELQPADDMSEPENPTISVDLMAVDSIHARATAVGDITGDFTVELVLDDVPTGGTAVSTGQYSVSGGQNFAINILDADTVQWQLRGDGLKAGGTVDVTFNESVTNTIDFQISDSQAFLFVNDELIDWRNVTGEINLDDLGGWNIGARQRYWPGPDEVPRDYLEGASVIGARYTSVAAIELPESDAIIDLLAIQSSAERAAALGDLSGIGSLQIVVDDPVGGAIASLGEWSVSGGDIFAVNVLNGGSQIHWQMRAEGAKLGAVVGFNVVDGEENELVFQFGPDTIDFYADGDLAGSYDLPVGYDGITNDDVTLAARKKLWQGPSAQPVDELSGGNVVEALWHTDQFIYDLG